MWPLGTKQLFVNRHYATAEEEQPSDVIDDIRSHKNDTCVAP